jgi:hypothetical protein
MIRLLLASLALLWLTATAFSDRPPNPTADAHAALFDHMRPESALLRSVRPRGSGPLTPGTLTVGKACGNT